MAKAHEALIEILDNLEMGGDADALADLTNQIVYKLPTKVAKKFVDQWKPDEDDEDE